MKTELENWNSMMRPMTSRYRIVHFMPNPASGTRFAVAALIEHDNQLSVTTASVIPSAGMLGGRQELLALKMVLERLSRAEDFSRLPVSVGPFVILDEPRNVPAGVDTEKWVSRRLHFGRAKTQR